MLTSLVLSGLLVFGGQTQHRAEYKFKGNLARFRTLQWNQMVRIDANIQVAETAEGKPSGTWVYFDMPAKKIIVGGPGSLADELVNYIEMFDIQPKTVRLTFTFSEPDKGFEMKGVLEPLNNQAVSIGSPETDGTLVVTPRVNDDGTVTLKVELKVGSEARGIAGRMKNGQRVLFEGARFMTGEHAGASSDKGVVLDAKPDFWKRFKIDITPEILDSK